MTREAKGVLDRASYKVEGDRLVASGRLDWPLDLTFDLCVRDLIDNSSAQSLEMDLTRVSRVTSPYIGVIAAAAKELKQGGRLLRVRVSDDISKPFMSAGVGEIAELLVGG